jgi:hypothetical protein
MTTTAAYNMGVAARNALIRRSLNPFPKHPLFAEYWTAGWDDRDEVLDAESTGAADAADAAHNMDWDFGRV